MFESRGIKVLDEIAEELELEDQRRAGGVRRAPRTGAARAAPSTASTAASTASRPGAASRARRIETEAADDELAAGAPRRRASRTPRAAASTRCACTSRRSARSRCSPPSRKSRSPSASRPACTPTEKLDGRERQPTARREPARRACRPCSATVELARRQLTEANLRLVVSIAKRYVGRGHGAARPHPGGQPRPDPCGREVRLHEGLQVLDLRDVVDPPGDHPRDRRPGPHHPHPGAHGRDDEQGAAHLSGRCCRSSAASRRSRRSRRRSSSRPTRCARSSASRRSRCRSRRRSAKKTTACSATSSRTPT